jgi:hypothetical protein
MMIFIVSEDELFERRGRKGYAEDAEKKNTKNAKDTKVKPVYKRDIVFPSAPSAKLSRPLRSV